MSLSCLFGGSVLDGGAGFVALTLSPHFGFVILTAIASMFMVVYLGHNVGVARKKFKVPYPTMYSDKNDTFNCYQRAHQNTLESYGTFLTLLFIGGLEMPILASISGWIWIIGRIHYAKGYYSGKPENRLYGEYFLIGLIALLIASIKFALRLAF